MTETEDYDILVPKLPDPRSYRARKRSLGARERDLVLIARWYMQGVTQTEITERLNAREDVDYTLSRVTIHNDIQKIREHWYKSILVDTDKRKADELAKIDNLEREYWEAWFRSLEPREQERVERALDGDQSHTTKEVTSEKTTSGNPAYLQGIQWCINKRVELFGLDAPKKTDIRMASVNLDLKAMSSDELDQLERILSKALPGSGEGGEGQAEPDRVHDGDVLEV